MANGWAPGKFAGEFSPARRLTLGSSNLVYFCEPYFAYAASHVRLWPESEVLKRPLFDRNWVESRHYADIAKATRVTHLRHCQEFCINHNHDPGPSPTC
jgi:hypothetical protein